MSVVPYRSRIVYHDRESQILVVHHNLENSIELYGSTLEDSRNDGSIMAPYSGLLSVPERRFTPDSNSSCCPACGADLTDAFGASDGARASGRPRKTLHSDMANVRETYNGARGPEGHRDRPDLAPFFAALGPANFMHQDYFQLLAELPYAQRPTAQPRALKAAKSLVSDAVPPTADIFNQGYFERFFRKIPPGVLGSGAHAQVYKVAHVLQGVELGVFAVKRIAVGDHLHYLDQVLNEVLILYELSAAGASEHNLIRYNHVWLEYGDLHDLPTYILDPRRGPASVDRVPYVFILQQYCDGGHLEHVLTTSFVRAETMSVRQQVEAERARRRERRGDHVSQTTKPWLSDLEVWKFFTDITTAVAYLHAHGILHRDLKPSNCLLESKYVPTAVLIDDRVLSEADFQQAVSLLPKVLVSDFGEGKFLHKKRPHNILGSADEERRGNTGTLEFTDPKLWLYDQVFASGKPKFAHKFNYDSDIYSLGMILCFLCVGQLPFSDEINKYGNPEAVKGIISGWHAALTQELFDSWFDGKTLGLRGHLSPILSDFKILIYLMIKGQTGKPKPSPKMFLNYLDSIKWRRLIELRNRSHSEATIVEMGELSVLKTPSEPISTSHEKMPNTNELHEDECIDTETLDLLAEVEDTSNPKALCKNDLFLLIATYKTVIFRCIYIMNLVLLEVFPLSQNTRWVQVLKLGNVVTLAWETNLSPDSRVQLVGFWALLSVSLLIYP